MKHDYKYSELTHQIIGCSMEVHRVLGNGFQEVIYQRSLAYELEQFAIGFAREVDMPIFYKGVLMGTRRADFLIEEKVMVELKAIIKLDDVHLAQAMNYLEAYNLEIGLLINFGAPSLEFRRVLNPHFRRFNTK
jgi:GxxExxY protein